MADMLADIFFINGPISIQYLMIFFIYNEIWLLNQKFMADFLADVCCCIMDIFSTPNIVFDQKNDLTPVRYPHPVYPAYPCE
jgi:hypothetical protein